MKNYIAAATIVIIGFSAFVITAQTSEAKNISRYVRTISPAKHQPIKASIVDNTPNHYTIDVKKFANLSANQEAPTFAVYVTNSLPARCGDFRNLAIPYKKPEKYKRVFNLSSHPDVLDAIEKYGCVVMKNIPPAG